MSGLEKAVSCYKYMHTLPQPSSRAKKNLDVWMNHYKPLVKPEADFINHHDLISLDPREDRGSFDEVVESVAERVLPFDIGYYVSRIYLTPCTAH